MSFAIFGVSFYVYGLIVGVALLLWIELCRSVLAKKHQSLSVAAVLEFFVVVLIGARLWHVATDVHLYTDNLREVMYITHGGMSILGALVAGVLWVRLRSAAYKLQWRVLLDAAALSLPFAQAVGRWANYVNQELYGLPTDAAWGIFIEPAQRVAPYLEHTHFHPLFFYESILLFVFGVVAWQRYRHNQSAVGTGNFVLNYLLFYACIRFLLDFLRVDTAVRVAGVGINQLVLLVVICCIVAYRVLYEQKTKR